MSSFNIDDDKIVGQISPDSIQTACEDLACLDEVDGVFVSCTSMRVIERIGTIELRVGKPVVSSNLALAWYTLQLSNVDTRPVSAIAKLFDQNLCN